MAPRSAGKRVCSLVLLTFVGVLVCTFGLTVLLYSCFLVFEGIQFTVRFFCFVLFVVIKVLFAVCFLALLSCR